MAIKTVTVEAKLNEKFKIQSNVRGHSEVIDQPVAMGGTDEGPTPLEYLFLAVAGCIGSIGRVVAMQKRLNVRGMDITVEGDLNTDGLLGKESSDPVGFKEILMSVKVDGDLSAEEKEAFIHEVDSRCPVSQNLIGETPFKVSVV